MSADASFVASRPSTRPSRTPTRRTRVLLAVGVMLAASILGACESNKTELDAVRNQVNASRAAAGLPALRENLALDIKADRWAQGMRDQCRIWHSRLADGAPPNWRKLGENVGMGGAVEQIHTAYMNSPGHRANILDPAFTDVGTAAVWGNCYGYRTLFTVHVFMKS